MQPRFLAFGVLSAASLALSPVSNLPTGHAQETVDIRCVGFESGGGRKALVHLHNAAAADTPTRVQWLSADGTVRETEDLVVPSGTTVDQVRRGEAIGIAVRIAPNEERLVVDAEMVYDDQGDELSRRTVTCTRVQ